MSNTLRREFRGLTDLLHNGISDIVKSDGVERFTTYDADRNVIKLELLRPDFEVDSEGNVEVMYSLGRSDQSIIIKYVKEEGVFNIGSMQLMGSKVMDSNILLEENINE